MGRVSVYIHVPFCRTQCPYCDFAVKRSTDTSEHALYIDALCQEIATRSARGASSDYNRSELVTIYIGGGTPSLLEGDLLLRIYDTLRLSFDWDGIKEFSIEVNPGTLTPDKVQTYIDIGINRISFGMQSFSPHLLKRIARLHTLKDFQHDWELVRSFGYRNLSLDLIYGLPGQTLSDWQETLTRALTYAPEHLSIYKLTIEEGTPFGRIYGDEDHPEIPQEESITDMYLYACEQLAQYGYEHYEISNFCQDGAHSLHNLNYWEAGEYYGFGVGAHEHLNGQRRYHTKNLSEYLAGPCKLYELESDLLEERLFLGLRLSTGISSQDLFDYHASSDNKFKLSQLLDELVHHQLVRIAHERIMLTKKGMLISNEIITRLLC